MASIQGVYLALFGRPADPNGLAFWEAETDGGADLSAMVGALTGTAEFTARFAGQSNAEIVNSIYQSLFDRDAEPEGLQFFLDGLADGTFTIETIAIAILDGAQGLDQAILTTKLAAANLFTQRLDLEIEVDAYAGEFAASVGRDFIDSIDPDNPPTPENTDEAIQRLFGDEAQEPGEGGTPGGGAGGGSDDRGYGNADVILLDNNRILERYDSDDYPNEDADSPVEAAFDDAVAGNTVLIQDMEQIGDFASIIPYATDLISYVLPSYEGWFPERIFLNEPGAGSEITGTPENDVALVVNGNQFSHTITGGRGQDVLITVGIDGPYVERTALEAETPGVHALDGGDDDDILVNVGGNDNILEGGRGNDLIASIGDAADTILGGTGNDIIFGGSDHGQSLVAFFFSGNSDGVFNVRVDVEDVAEVSDYVIVEPRSMTQNQITFLGQLPNGDNIIRLNNGGEGEVTWTLNQTSGGTFSSPVTIPANQAAIINVGSDNGSFRATGPDAPGGSATTSDRSLDLSFEASFDGGDTLIGGAGEDIFVYLPEGDLAGALPEDILGLGDITSNGADTIVGFATGEDKIALIVAGNVAEEGDFFQAGSDFGTFSAAAGAAAAANKQFFFAAGVEGDGYLFVDDNVDGQVDFSIRLEGLVNEGDLVAGDIEVLDVEDLIGGVDSAPIAGLAPMMDVA